MVQNLVVKSPVSLIGISTTDHVGQSGDDALQDDRGGEPTAASRENPDSDHPASTTLDRLRTTFDQLGHQPTPSMWEGIEDLLRCVYAMADGWCVPKFFVSSLDPGVGKTQAVIHVLQDLIVNPAYSHVSAVVFMFSKKEIRKMVSDLDLPREQVAVITSDDDVNQLGADDPTNARILITTQ